MGYWRPCILDVTPPKDDKSKKDPPKVDPNKAAVKTANDLLTSFKANLGSKNQLK